MFTTYLVALGSLMLAQVSPGPNLLAVAGTALGQGLKTALFVTLGIATAIFVYVSAMCFGLSALLTVYPPILIAMKIVGGAYLCFLAVKAFRAAVHGSGANIRVSEARLTLSEAWRRGLLVNLTNPKSALFWGALTTMLFGAGLTPLQVFGFAPLGFMSACIVYGTYSVLFSNASVRRAYARFMRAIETAFGLVFGALGAALLWDGARDVMR